MVHDDAAPELSERLADTDEARSSNRRIGIEDLGLPAPMGHEYAGILKEIGARS